jgi:excisionase family DNA binding protein
VTANNFDPRPVPLLDYDQLAVWLNDSVRHLRRLVDEKRIPYHKVGHFVRFDERGIIAWLQANSQMVTLPGHHATKTPARRPHATLSIALSRRRGQMQRGLGRPLACLTGQKVSRRSRCVILFPIRFADREFLEEFTRAVQREVGVVARPDDSIGADDSVNELELGEVEQAAKRNPHMAQVGLGDGP